MITAFYDRAHQKLTLKGHAGAGIPGQDLVCCAASILTYTLAANVRAMQKRGWLRQYAIRLTPGDAEVSCQPEQSHRNAVVDRLDALWLGFQLLQRDYPEFVVLTPGEK